MASTNRYQKFIASCIRLLLILAQTAHVAVCTENIYFNRNESVDIELKRHTFEYIGHAVNISNTTEMQFKLSGILKDVYTTIARNIGENSRKLDLEDFHWGVFDGVAGRLEGFNNFELVNENTTTTAQNGTLKMSFEFAVPSLRATWTNSTCLGHHCAMTMEMKNASFVLRMIFDANDCVVEHLAYLKNYNDAKCYAKYHHTTSIFSSNIIQTTVKLLSHLINTPPFRKIIANNVNYAILKLPVFSLTDIGRICNVYREL